MDSFHKFINLEKMIWWRKSDKKWFIDRTNHWSKNNDYPFYIYRGNRCDIQYTFTKNGLLRIINIIF